MMGCTEIVRTLEFSHQEIPADRMNLYEYYCTKHSPGKCNVFWSKPSSGVVERENR